MAFGYFVVLPAAVRFFVNFNSSEFNVLVQASQFYKFAATVLLAMGLVFQVPVVILAATRIGLVTVEQLRKSRRYAIVACAAVAAFLPGDAITLVLETVPLYVLYEASILVASLVARRAAARDGAPREFSGESGAAHQRRPSGAERAADNRPRGPGPHRLMLFDLRGRHRRRAVKVIYIGLALLIGVGLVGFGIGGGRRRRTAQRGQRKRRLGRRELLRPNQEVRKDAQKAAEQRRGLGKTDRGAAARSRRRSVRQREHRPADGEGQGTVRARPRARGKATSR